MPLFEISADPQQLAALRAALSPQRADTAINRVVKKTTAWLPEIITKRLREDTTFRTAAEKQIGQPKYQDGVGTLVVASKPLSLMAFEVSAPRHGPVTVQIEKDRSPLVLRHAFRATMRSGHVGIFQRSRHLPTKGPNMGKGKLTPMGFAGRLAIEEQFGPRLVTLIQRPDTLEGVTKDAQAFMAETAQKELSKGGE